jgi:Zn-dependent M28 family amino/carboxypeptidase
MNLLPLTFAAAIALMPGISAERIREDVRVLSSDEFEGRGPGEAGDRRTVEYLSKAFAAAGLEAGGVDGGWTQPVALVRLDRQPGATISLKVADRSIALTPGANAALTLRNPGRTDVKDAPLMFGGYGVTDASRGWGAYDGVDMRGKVIVVLANDPDFDADRDLGFEGRRMALAGRIGIKFEVAARAGALGVLVIHEDAAASYPFFQVGSGDALPTFVLEPAQASSLQFTGWLRGDAAADLLTDSGLDIETLKRRSREPSFRAFPIKDATVRVMGEVKATDVVSHNVLARITGSSRPDEYVIFGAHWDANGRNGPDAKGDPIRNGAIDNATGTAEVLEIARVFAKGPRPARTVIFAAWTAEEKGLLGAEAYVANPVYPLARTAAVNNLDPHVVLPAARNIELIGGGRTELELRLAEAAAKHGLRVTLEPNPEAGWYFRSDHFPFAKRGVPALAFRAGRDLVEGGTAAGNTIVDPYNERHYHQTTDEFDPDWTFAGTAQEASVAYELGRAIANESDWPAWYPGNEYGAVRATSETERRRDTGAEQTRSAVNEP